MITPVTEDRLIFFNEKAHSYTDNCGNKYTSMTTVIGKYEFEEDFKAIAVACERIGKNPNHPKYLKYKGLTVAQIIAGWNKTKDDALVNGTTKHNYLEEAVKKSNGYKLVEGNFINDRIYTIKNIVNNDTFGRIELDYFVTTGIATRYPKIYATLKSATELGWKIYSEIGVYNTDYLISGLIDLLLVRGNEFIIIDWKTNKADIRFESGYYDKDINGELTDTFITKDKKMKYPINYLPDSIGNHYALQLSGYTFMVERFGFKSVGNILFQIRDSKIDGELERVDHIQMPDLIEDVRSMFEHHKKEAIKQTQAKLFI